VGWSADSFSAVVTQCDEATSCSKRKCGMWGEVGRAEMGPGLQQSTRACAG